MEYISNLVIQDGESESVHPFPAHKQPKEFWGWWRKLHCPPPSPAPMYGTEVASQHLGHVYFLILQTELWDKVMNYSVCQLENKTHYYCKIKFQLEGCL